MTTTLPRPGTTTPPALPATSGILVVDRSASSLATAYLTELCRHFAALKVPVTLATPHAAAARDGVAARRLAAPSFLPAVLAGWWCAVVTMWAAMRTGADIVVVAGDRPGGGDAFAVRLLHLLSRRVVWAPRTVPADGVLDAGARRTYERSEVVVVISATDRSRLGAALKHTTETTVRVVPLGDLRDVLGSLEEQSAARRPLGLGTRGAVVAVIGDAAAASTAALLQAVAAADTTTNATELLVVDSGTGSGTDALTALARSIGLGDGLRIVPMPTELADLAPYLAASDAVACLDDTDGDTAIVAGLARAAGRPVLVPAASGLADALAEPIEGEVVRSLRPDDLADGLRRLLVPRRALRQRQFRLERSAPPTTWTSVVNAWTPALMLNTAAQGRRLSVKGTSRFIKILWGFLLWFMLTYAIAATERGISIKNIQFVLAVLLPIAVLSLLVVPYEVKFVCYIYSLIFGDLIHRVLFPAPVQLVPAMMAVWLGLHLLLQPPPVPGKTRNTRFLHAIVLLIVLWSIVEVFNPNLPNLAAGVRATKNYLEPFIFYGAALVFFRSTKLVRQFTGWLYFGATLALLWGAKIAFIGYFAFEMSYLRTTGQDLTISESRNIGTMTNPMTWGMFCTAMVLLSITLLLHAKSVSYKPLLFLVIPLGLIGVVSSGQRIQFISLAVALPVVLIPSLGAKHLRLQATAMVVLGAVMATAVWFWIPDQGDPRRTNDKNPIDAARIKLASVKNPKNDTNTVQDRVFNGTKAIEAITTNPMGGGTGLLLFAGFGTSSDSGGSSLSIGGVDNVSRGRNRIPVQAGDFFYLNWLVEQGFPGTILICLLFALALGWCFMTFVRSPDPMHRSWCLAGAAWVAALVVNSVTNGAFFANQTSSVFFLFLAVAVCVPRIEEVEGLTPTVLPATERTAPIPAMSAPVASPGLPTPAPVVPPLPAPTSSTLPPRAPT